MQDSGFGSGGRASIHFTSSLACTPLALALAPLWLRCLGCCCCHRPWVLHDSQLHLVGLWLLLEGRGEQDHLLGKVLPGSSLGRAKLTQHGGPGMQNAASASSHFTEVDDNSVLSR